jgi:hypothetical protein
MTPAPGYLTASKNHRPTASPGDRRVILAPEHAPRQGHHGYLVNGTSLCQAAAAREETNLLNLAGRSRSAAMIFKVVVGVARETPVALLG